VGGCAARQSVASETRLLPFLGLACAVGVSSIYYNQPLLLEMRETLLTTPAHIGLVAMATQIGYAAGLLFFVPLGDILERRRLIMRLFGGVALALLLVASAPTLQLLIMASALVGTMASVTHIVLPLASEIAPHGDRTGMTVCNIGTNARLMMAASKKTERQPIDLAYPTGEGFRRRNA
jgi:MFS family permease